MENKVLGKGLSALIPERKEVSILENPKETSVNFIKTSLIKDNSLQPRQNYDESKLADLMASIKEKGVLQPILVRNAGAGYEVVAGERRLRAARALGLEQVPVIVKAVTDKEALVLALVENIQREELNPIEEAQGFKRLIEEFHYTQEDVAQAIGKDRTTVTNLLRLLRLPQEVATLVLDGKVSMGHARALLSLPTATEQISLAHDIVAKGLSVRQVESLVKKNSSTEETVAKINPKQRDIQILEEELQRTLGTKVTVADKGNKGTLTIAYYSLDDLDRILNILRK